MNDCVKDAGSGGKCGIPDEYLRALEGHPNREQILEQLADDPDKTPDDWVLFDEFWGLSEALRDMPAAGSGVDANDVKKLIEYIHTDSTVMRILVFYLSNPKASIRFAAKSLGLTKKVVENRVSYLRKFQHLNKFVGDPAASDRQRLRRMGERLAATPPVKGLPDLPISAGSI